MPLRWTLATGSGIAVLLVLALTATMIMENGWADASQARAAAAASTELHLQDALLAARELRVAAHVIRLQPIAAAVSASEGSARARSAQARAELARIGQESAVDEELLAHVRQALDTFDATVSRAAALRTGLITLRDDIFITRLSGLQSQLDLLILRLQRGSPDGGSDELRALVIAYRDALSSMVNETLRFLATADDSSRDNAVVSASMAATYAKRLAGADIPLALSKDVQEVVDMGTTIASGTDEIFQIEQQLAEDAAGAGNRAELALEDATANLRRAVASRARVATAQANHDRSSAKRDAEWLCGTLALFLLLSSIWSSSLIVRPLLRLTVAVQRIAAGDTARPVSDQGRRDEIGRMAGALEALRRAVEHAFTQAQIIEQNPLGILLADPDTGRVSYANAEMEAVFARLGRGAWEGQAVQTLLPEPGLLAAMRDPALLPYSGSWAEEEESVSFRAHAVLDRQGHCTGIAVAVRNTTERGQLARQFQFSVASVAETVGGASRAMRDTAAAMVATAEETGELATAVAFASAQTADNVASVAAAAEQLACSVDQISRQVATSATIATRAVGEARAADHCMFELNETASRIGDVVRLIGEIAARTNLLALNATIEAARAGDAGRGFAVVASEVKMLANQTARATEEIGSQIAGMQEHTGQAVVALRTIAETIQQLDGISTDIAGAVQEQRSATRQIATAVQQVAIGTEQVSVHIGGVTGAVTRTRAQSSDVFDAAGALGEQSDCLRGEVRRFLSEVRLAA